jgi:PKD repeat protein
LLACSYAWDFGDGTTGAGLTTTHAFSRFGNYAVRLVVTDARGAQALTTQSVSVGAPVPPTVGFQISPSPAPVGVDVFFNASESKAADGRTITNYEWDFGDGSFSRGVAVSHKYSGAGSYTIILTATDDAGATNRVQKTLQVGPVTQSVPVVNITASPTAGKPGQRVVFDASASTPSTGSVITSYKFDYGDGTVEVVTSPQQSHTYVSAGTFVASVEVTDSNGKTATKQVTITLTP